MAVTGDQTGLNFTIIEGNTGGVFAIDEDGEITVASNSSLTALPVTLTVGVDDEDSGATVNDFANVTISSSADDDGIGVEVEDGAPNAGDGNKDGIRDAEQANVASLPAATGRGYITIEVLGGCSRLKQVETFDATTLTADPLGHLYKFGLVAFSLPCESAQLEITFHDASSADFKGAAYRKYGPVVPGDSETTGWYDFSGSASVTGNRWVLELADNQLGDDTGNDGVIVDLGGPSIAPARVVGIPVDQTWSLFILVIATMLIALWFTQRKQH